MATRTEKNKNALRDKHQAILAEMLREDANRLCADCHSKGPRWSSWNIGVFLCIRCAGIHRNLGVHVSKVKSVNLDSWTPEQIDNIVQWGNLRAKEVYECYLPSDFCRPQGDSAMETFIRSKYERKLYMVKGDIANVGRATSKFVKEPKNEEQTKSSEQPSKVERPSSKSKPASQVKAERPSTKQIAAAATTAPTRTAKPAVVADLLSMDDVNHSSSNDDNRKPADSFDLFAMDNTTSGFGQQMQQQQQQSQDPFASSSTAAEPRVEQSLFPDEANPSSSRSTKDSIMSLYGANQSQHQQQPQYGIPGGVYMPNSTQPGPYNMPIAHYPQQAQSYQGMQPVQMQANTTNQGMAPRQQQQMPFHAATTGQLPQQMQQMRIGGMTGVPSHQGPMPGGFGGQSHQPMAATGYYPHNMAAMMGQGMMNANWQGQSNAAQQPIMVNSGASSGIAMKPTMNGSNMMGQTLSNQLWN